MLEQAGVAIVKIVTYGIQGLSKASLTCRLKCTYHESIIFEISSP
jgi:hypothetical protein